jgi:hypothetical protein
MAKAVSRRPLTAEARVRSQVTPCGVFGGQSGTGTGFSPSCRFSPVSFIPLVLHYLSNLVKKTAHLHHRVAQKALRLWYVRSICCGALHHVKKKRDLNVFILSVRNTSVKDDEFPGHSFCLTL